MLVLPLGNHLWFASKLDYVSPFCEPSLCRSYCGASSVSKSAKSSTLALGSHLWWADSMNCPFIVSEHISCGPVEDSTTLSQNLCLDQCLYLAQIICINWNGHPKTVPFSLKTLLFWAIKFKNCHYVRCLFWQISLSNLYIRWVVLGWIHDSTSRQSSWVLLTWSSSFQNYSSVL